MDNLNVGSDLENVHTEGCVYEQDNEIKDNAENKCSLKKDNRGIGVVEIVLILVVLIALIIIFKDKIVEIINAAFESISEGAGSL